MPSPKPLPVDHKEMIEAIQGLPPIVFFDLHTLDQQTFARCECKLWKAIGERIDFLQHRQLGFRSKDPALTLPIQIKDYVVVVSDQFFELLGVLIDGFDVIKAYAKGQNRNLPYESPRELLFAICYELAGRRLVRATTPTCNVGKTLKESRTIESRLGKFIRGSLEEETVNEMLERMERSGYLVDFCVVAIYRSVGINRLKKWASWRRYQKAQTAYRRFSNRKDVATIKWNAGHAVFSDTASPASTMLLNIS